MERATRRSVLSLYERFPGLESRLESCDLGSFPTPVHELCLPGLEKQNLWIKRDDLSSPQAGGNKVRKLELLLARGSDPVLTFGPWGSHHVLTTAWHARALGRDCHAVLVPQAMDPHHEEVRALIRRYCVSTLEIQTLDLAGLHTSLAALPKWLASLRLPKRLRLVPPGGTCGLGALGYVAAGFELRSQIEAGQCPEPQRVYVPLGTGGTAAGLALGLALAGLRTQVVAVRVASLFVGHSWALHTLASQAHQTLRSLGVRVEMPRLRLRVSHRFIGKGYAAATVKAARALNLARSSGLTLEMTYTAKTLAAMLDERSGETRAEPWMLLNTFGPFQGEE